MDEADTLQNHRLSTDLVEGSTFQPARASMMDCIQEMKTQVKELKRAQASGWFDNDNFSRLLREQETRASEFRQATAGNTSRRQVNLPRLLPHQSAALLPPYTATPHPTRAPITPKQRP